MQATATLDRYLPLLAEGDTDGVRALFAGMPHIDAPRTPPVGPAGLAPFVSGTREWLARLGADVRFVARTLTSPREVLELELDVTVDGRRTVLPMALVADLGHDGTLVSLRVYHSTWPLTGRHEVRPPILPCRGRLEAPDIVGRYQSALAAGDLDKTLTCFEADGYAREPAGGEWTHRGREDLRDFYVSLLSSGGIPLKHCTITDDGIRCGIEYVADRWGATELPPQAGVAVYERGDSVDHLSAARIYDDIEPPVSR